MHVTYNLDDVSSFHFSMQQFKLLQNFENTTFPLVSMVELFKNCLKTLANCLNLCRFKMHG